MISNQQRLETDGVVGTRDGLGAGDHDQPYRFGWRPRTAVPYRSAPASTCACWSCAVGFRTALSGPTTSCRAREHFT
jgi:hypothetical protein